MKKSWEESLIGGLDRTVPDDSHDFTRWSCVYFLQAESGPIKIGSTNCLTLRIPQIQIGNHENLSIIGAISGDEQIEKYLHEKFRRHRIRGEWFRPHKHILTYINQRSEYRDPVKLAIIPIREGELYGVADATSKTMICLMKSYWSAFDFVERFNWVPFSKLALPGLHIPIDYASGKK